jgi:hypothetical protein
LRVISAFALDNARGLVHRIDFIIRNAVIEGRAVMNVKSNMRVKRELEVKMPEVDFSGYPFIYPIIRA